MRILDRYIGRSVSAGVVTVLAVLLAVFTFFEFVDELDDLGRGSYRLWSAVSFVLLSMPRLGYDLFPVAALIGTLMGLGSLVSTGEMTVVRCSGVSVWRTAGAVLKAGAVLTVLALLVGEFVLPPAEQSARLSRSVALTSQVAMKSRNGFWARDGSSFVNVRRVLPGNRLEEIFIYEFDDHHQLKVATHAGAAVYEEGGWRLQDIEQTVFTDHGTERRVLDQAAWESLLRPELVNLVVVKPRTLSLRELMQFIGYLDRNEQDTQRYEQALWGKLVYPVTVMAMMLLAIPIVLRSSRAAGVGQRIVAGAFIGLGFHLVSQATASLGIVLNLSPAAAASLPTLALLAAASGLMRGVR